MLYYTLIEKFGMGAGIVWDRYMSENGFTHLREVLSLDASLCPPYQVQSQDSAVLDNSEVFGDDLELYSDLSQSFEEIENIFDPSIYNFLCVQIKPESNNLLIPPFKFKFGGFDLLDFSTRISVIVNCGRLDKAFKHEDLNIHGLIINYEKAEEIQRKVKENYPSLSHNNTTLIAIWYFEADANILESGKFSAHG
jgi:hypothetical protein